MEVARVQKRAQGKDGRHSKEFQAGVSGADENVLL